MFKTLYSKYLSSFIALLGVGFFTIAVIICSVVTNYSSNTKADLMHKTAYIVHLEISNEMTDENCSFEEAVEENTEKYNTVFSAISEYSESNIMLISKDGKILYKNAPDSVFANKTIGTKTMYEIINSTGPSKPSDLGGLFADRRFNYIYNVVDEQASPIGYIVLTSSASGMSPVFEQIIKVIIIASLWVFLAAIIIVWISNY